VAPSGTQVKAHTVESALCSVGQTIAALGYHDPRLQPSGKLDLRLHRQLQAYSKANPTPARVKPIAWQIIQHVVHQCYTTPDARLQTVSQMIAIGFFFLLQPGEYAFTNNPESAPFRLQDVHLLRYNVRLSVLTCPEQDLDAATHVALEFTKQKNGVWGELVGLGRSGHPFLCPVKAVVARLKHHRLHRDLPYHQLYQCNTGTHWAAITTSELTQHFRHATHLLGHTASINPSDISIRSLRSSGAMALLCADIDPDCICLLGCWRSDEMMRYLHVQALPIVAPLASLMVQHGFFTLLPNNPMESWGASWAKFCHMLKGVRANS
jgi:hypothetical protein